MKAYKGFNKDLSCTRGNGKFNYSIGKKYVEEKAKTANCGFHCVEEPLDVLDWYEGGRYCLVEIGGDINENGNRIISCTEIEIVKELTLHELVVHECAWIVRHPQRQFSDMVGKESAVAERNKGFAIAIGKNPKAMGRKIGDIIAIMKYEDGACSDVGIYVIDNQSYKPNVWYDCTGEVAR